ncbi:MAG TPA: hypothetical protein PLO35_00675 [Candidatus Cloacimonadota bacterium]|nr:hypothetical protein [Candidatus Cloacimonadota bacterium]
MKKILLGILILSLFSLAMAQTTQRIIAQNQSPLTYIFGQTPLMRVEINQGLEEITEIRLRYRIASETAENRVYLQEAMKPQAPDSPVWEAFLPGDYIADYDIEYYFEFKLADLSVEVMPWEYDINSPFLITPGKMKGRIEEGFVLLSQDDEIDQSDGFVFAVSFFEIADEIEPNSLKVWVGGKDVTRKAVISENTIVYRDKRSRAGEVKAFVTARIEGDDVQSHTWKAKVQGGKFKLPVKFNGSVNFASNVYDYQYTNVDSLSTVFESRNDWTSWGDLTATSGRITAYTNLHLSSDEDRRLQRVNRYTVGLKTPFLELAAGDYTPSLSQFTMNNRNLYGLYGKLFAKYIGLEVAAGEMVRSTYSAAVLEDSTNVMITAPSATFRQEAIGARLRLGLEEGLSIGINGIRNRDIKSSLSTDHYMYTTATGDTVISVTPKDNLVLSIDARLNIPDQNVLLGMEVAGSLLNNNTLDSLITSQDIEDMVPDLPDIDPGELSQLFWLNTNLEPLMPSRNNLAWMAFFRTFFWNNLFHINYSVTGSAFNALGTYYQQNDTSVISITDQFYLGRVLTLSGGYNLTSDNQSGTYAEQNKSTAWFVQSLFRFPNLPYLKASFFTNNTHNINNADIQPDTLFIPYKRNANNFSVGLGYDFKQIPIVPSQLDITYRASADSKNQGDDEVQIYENFSNSINVTMSNRMGIIPLRTQVVFSLSNQERKLGLSDPTIDSQFKDDNYTLFAKAEYALFKNRLIPYVTFRRVHLTGDQEEQSFDYLSLGIDASPIKDMSVSTSISQKYHRFEDLDQQDNDTFTWRFQISQRF